MSNSKLSFLRTVLKPLGLSENAIDKTIEFISDLLFEKDETSSSKIEYPYYLCEEFITPAELNSVNHRIAKGSPKTGVRANARTPVFGYSFNFRDLLKFLF